jgi:hypothetical protein
MLGLVRKSLDSPEETRPFEGGTGQLQLVNLEQGGVGRGTFLPGWRWSEHVKPIAKTESRRICTGPPITAAQSSCRIYCSAPRGFMPSRCPGRTR